MTASAESLFRPALFEKLPKRRFVASIIALLPAALSLRFLRTVTPWCSRVGRFAFQGTFHKGLFENSRLLVRPRISEPALNNYAYID
jgi:hypothetical protein